MTQAAHCTWEQTSNEKFPSAAPNAAPSRRFEVLGTRENGTASRVQKLGPCPGLTYSTPLVVNRRICIFRRSQSATPERPGVAVPKTHSEFGEKRRSAKFIGWFEFQVGPYVISLNSLVLSDGNVS